MPLLKYAEMWGVNCELIVSSSDQSLARSVRSTSALADPVTGITWYFTTSPGSTP
jgi:hypothetical protein